MLDFIIDAPTVKVESGFYKDLSLSEFLKLFCDSVFQDKEKLHMFFDLIMNLNYVRERLKKKYKRTGKGKAILKKYNIL